MTREEFATHFAGDFTDMEEAFDLFNELRLGNLITLLLFCTGLGQMQKSLGAYQLMIDRRTLKRVQGPSGRLGYLIPDKYNQEQFSSALAKARKLLWEAMGYLEHWRLPKPAANGQPTPQPQQVKK